MGFFDKLKGLGNDIVRVGKDKSPALLIFGGAALLIGGAVLACKESMDLKPILEDHKQRLEEIGKECQDESKVDYGVKEAKHDIFVAHYELGKKLMGKYLWSALMAVGGTVMIAKGYNAMDGRLAEAIAFGTTTYKGWQQYRKNVIADKGVEADKKYMLGNLQKIPFPVKDEEGKETGEMEERNAIPIDGPAPCQLSPFAFKFDDTNDDWSNNPVYRKATILRLRSVLQSQLDSGYLTAKGKRFVTMNTCYEIYGVKQRNGGLTSGWVKKEGEDVQIDLGPFWEDECESPLLEDRGTPGHPEYHEYIWIDPNCQPYIGDKL